AHQRHVAAKQYPIEARQHPTDRLLMLGDKGIMPPTQPQAQPQHNLSDPAAAWLRPQVRVSPDKGPWGAACAQVWTAVFPVTDSTASRQASSQNDAAVSSPSLSSTRARASVEDERQRLPTARSIESLPWRNNLESSSRTLVKTGNDSRMHCATACSGSNPR